MSNVNDVRVKGIPINLDGTERHLRFTLNAFAELEDAYGSIDAAMDAVQKGSMKAVRKLIWAGLLHEDENLTEKHVGNLIDSNNIQKLTQDLTTALGAAVPSNAPNASPNTLPQK